MSNVPAKPDSRREPDEDEMKAMGRAYNRLKERPVPLEYRVDVLPTGAVQLGSKHSQTAGHILQALDTFGTRSDAFVDQNVSRLITVMQQGGHDAPTETEVNAAIATVAGIAPQNETEAMLAVQMTATHEVAMDMLTRAKLSGDPNLAERFGNLATKMSRTFTSQVEALSKLRRGGEQTVRVEHVHVYPGGQAIVGNVSHQPGPTGGTLENGSQAYGPTDPRALAFAPIAPVLCPDPPRDGVPVSRNKGEAQVPHPRRSRRKRGTEG